MMRRLHEALARRDLSAFRALLSQDPACIERADEAGVPLSHRAAGTGDLAIVRYVAEYTRASLSATDARGRDLLHYAAEAGDLECCRYLVERCGMDPAHGDLRLETPLETASRLDHEALVRYFEGALGLTLGQTYKNPVRRGMFPDPSVVRVGEDYYMVNSSFIYFPCIPISHSRDLVHWRVVGHAITRSEWAGLDGLEGGRGYWAPDISYCGGLFYVCATYRLNDGGPVLRRQMVVTSPQPEGPYSEPAFIDEDGIDPSLFHDEDGRHYMLLNRGARILEVDALTQRPLSEATMLYYGDCKRAPEGPHLLKKDGYYYLFLAEGGTGSGHRETVARARTLRGPYTPCPYNPILRQQDEGALLQRCGHGKPVCTQKGEWYMVYLCARALQGRFTLMGRETALDPITWTADGWPLVNGGRGPSALQRLPHLPASAAGPDEDDYVTPRAPGPGVVTRQRDGVRIAGAPWPLTDIRCRSLLVRRQTAFACAYEATLEDAFSLPDGAEAGLVCYYDERSFLTFSLQHTADGARLRAREQAGLETRAPLDMPLRRLTVALRLRVQACGLERRLSYALPGDDWQEVLCLPDTSYLSDEGIALGKRFTGAMLGVYALYGAQARFSHIRYETYED